MKNILIVEDDLNIHKILEHNILLINDKVKVHKAASIKGALSIINDVRIDVFIIDIELEDGSGIDLALKIREMERYQLSFIIFCTAELTKERYAFKNIHCYDYITKPFSEIEIQLVLSKVIMEPKKYLKIEQKNYISKIEFDDIIYISTRNKIMEFVRLDENTKVKRYSLEKVKKQLTDEFIQCYRSIIFNKKYFSRMDNIENIITLNARGRTYRLNVSDNYKADIRGKINHDRYDL